MQIYKKLDGSPGRFLRGLGSDGVRQSELSAPEAKVLLVGGKAIICFPDPEVNAVSLSQKDVSQLLQELGG